MYLLSFLLLLSHTKEEQKIFLQYFFLQVSLKENEKGKQSKKEQQSNI